MEPQFWPQIGAFVAEAQEVELQGVNSELTKLISEKDYLMAKETKVEKVPAAHYGFEQLVEKEILPDTKVIDKRIESVREKQTKLESFAHQANELVQELAKLGLTAIAYVPTKLFRSLCHKFGLWRFEHLNQQSQTEALDFRNSNGFMAAFVFGVSFILTELIALIAVPFGSWRPALTVLVGYFFLTMAIIVGRFIKPVSLPGKVTKYVSRVLLVLAWLFSLVMVGGAIKPVWFPAADLYSLVSTTFMVQLVAVIILIALFITSAGRVALIIANCYGSYLSHLSSKQQLKRLFPDMVDSDKGQTITVKFIKAPEYFLAALAKLGSQKSRFLTRPMIAATPEAIILDPDEVKRVGTKLAFEALGEPILYVTNNKATAIVSNFGKFPNEEAIMYWVRREGLKLCFN